MPHKLERKIVRPSKDEGGRLGRFLALFACWVLGGVVLLLGGSYLAGGGVF